LSSARAAAPGVRSREDATAAVGVASARARISVMSRRSRAAFSPKSPPP